MRAREGVAGERVVERRAPRLAPVHELELGALVLDVALPAIAVLRARVQALAGGDPLLQRLVARQALGLRDPLPGVVTVEAARAALELGVRAAQGSGRDLGACAGGEPEEHDAGERAAPQLASHGRLPQA